VLGSQFRISSTGAIVSKASLQHWSGGSMRRLLVSGEARGANSSSPRHLFLRRAATPGLFAMSRGKTSVLWPRAWLRCRLAGDRDPLPRHAEGTGAAGCDREAFLPVLFQFTGIKSRFTPILFAAGLAGASCATGWLVFNSSRLARRADACRGPSLRLSGRYFVTARSAAVAAAMAGRTGVFADSSVYGATIFRHGDPVRSSASGMNLTRVGTLNGPICLASRGSAFSGTFADRRWVGLAETRGITIPGIIGGARARRAFRPASRRPTWTFWAR